MWWKVLLSVLLLGSGIFAFMYFNNAEEVDFSQLNTIRDRIDGRGQLVDYDNTINVDDIGDIGYSVEDGELRIYFGNIPIDCTKKALANSDFMRDLKQIGITIKGDKKTNSYKVYYKGEKVSQLARSE